MITTGLPTLPNLRSVFGDVFFSEDGHRYRRRWEPLTSVTTAIGNYHTTFDSEFWSTYKALRANAIEFTYDKEDRIFATDRGVLTPQQAQLTFFLDPSPDYFLEQWHIKAEKARKRGTKIHNAIESYLHGKIIEPRCPGFEDWYDRENLRPLATEVVVAGEKIAGQVDALFQRGTDIVLGDWKTNETIKRSNSYDRMHPPLDHLEDCNYVHYCLQVSIYRRLLELGGFAVDDQFMLHIDHSGIVTHYAMPYLREEADHIIKNPEG